jgi:succinate dehydrogenase/fumarate reductase flavoprotein subunit
MPTGMQAAVDDIQALRQRYRSVRVQDTGKPFNTDLLEIIELGNLLDLSLLTRRVGPQPPGEPRGPQPGGFSGKRR